MKNVWSIIHSYLDRLSIPGSGANRVQRYGLVIALTLVIFLIKTTLSNVIGKDIPFLFALFIVILSAWFGGLGPGLFATGLSGLLTYFFFLEPKYTLGGEENIPNLIILLFFFLEGVVISILSESHRKSDVQKTEFIGVISHELKNPLASMKGYAEIIQRLADKNGDKNIAEFALRINQQIRHVIEMINEMLDITKIETGRLTYQDEIFNITDLVAEIVKDQQVTTKTHKIYFSNKKDIIIRGDRYRIGQVVTNLISNALKYSPRAKKVQVKLEAKKKSIILSVQDFGLGISKKDQSKLFNPFFRAKNTHNAKGTGIGLFISSQIVKRHKGKLWMKSTLGKGSTFYLQLFLRNPL